MSKEKTVLYFQKQYSVLIHSLSVAQRVSIATLGMHSAHKQLFERTLNYSINQVVDVSCIDLVQNGTTISDNQPLVSISTFDNRDGKKIEVGVARFDMNFEKILRADSSVIYSKELEGGRGTLSYKFISVKTKTLTEEEYFSCKKRKDAVEVQLFKDQQSLKIKNLMDVLNEKNHLVEELEKKIQELIVETNRRGSELANQRERAIEKKIELSMKINPVQRHLKHENDTLKAALEQEIEKSKHLEWQLGSIENQKEAIERSLVMSKQQYDQLNQLFKSSKSKKQIKISAAESRPKFLKHSTDDNDAVIERGLQDSEAKIAVLEPPKEELRRRRNTVAEVPSMVFGSYVKNPKRLDTVMEEEVSKLNEQPMKTSSYVSKGQSSKALPMNAREELLSPTRIEGSMARIEDDQNQRISQVSKRINLQKEDLKLTSIIFQKDQQLILLQKKCQLFEAQAKQLQKQLDRCQQLIKKKQLQIRQIKKRSKKNLLLEASSRDLGTSKNRSEIQAHFQKLQAEHESEKAASDQMIDKLEIQLKTKNKEIKDLKLNFEESVLKEKTLADRYSKLKIANKKAAQELIEHKEKSLQYDKLLLTSRELEAENKLLKEKTAVLSDENSKLEVFYNKFNSKCKEQEQQLDKLRKMERQFDYLKNQNTNLRQSVESFEVRYSELKKYCLKIEAAYSKFISKQKKGGFSSQDLEEDKQIQSKFAQLNKKVNEYQLSYFKQQLEDYKDESQFIQMYYQKKKRQEKQKIMESKDLSQEMKESSLKAKDVEFDMALNEKMSQIKNKMENISKNLVEVQHRSMEGSETFIESVPEKMKKIEMKVSSIIEREHEREKDRIKLKDTIQNMEDELRLGRSNVVNLNQVSSQNDLLKSMIAQNRQRKTMLEEARLKSQQVQLKAYEENRKLNTNLMRENHETKSQLSKLKMEAERAQRKAQERQKNMEAAFKKGEYEYKLKIEKLTEDLEKAHLLMDKVKEDCEEQRSGVSKLQTEMTHLSCEVEDKDIEIGSLNEKIQTLQSELNDCRMAEKQMKEEVQQIKAKAELNEKQFLSLIDARSADFLKIEQLKQAENQKLKTAISMLEQSLQTQMYQNMKHVTALQKQKEEMEKLEKETEAKIQNYVLSLQNRSKELDDLYLKEMMMQKQNETLKATLIQISSEIQNKEVENVELNYKIQSLQKQISIYEKQAPQYQNLEKKMKEQVAELNMTLKDKNYQLKYFEQKFMRIQTEVELSGKELERLSALNTKYQETICNWQEKQRDKEEEIIKLKEENSLSKIEIEKIKLVYSSLGQENETLKELNKKLQYQISQLNQSIQKIQEEKDAMAEEVRKASSPSNRNSRQKPIPKKAGTMELSVNDSLAFGGITPINPLPMKGFPKRVDSIDSNKDDLLQIPKKSSVELKKGDQTQIQIHLEQDFTDMSRMNVVPQFGKQSQDHSQLLTSNIHSLMQTNIGMNNNQLIAEESEQHKEHTYAYDKNIDLGDHDENSEQLSNLRGECDKMREEMEKLKQKLAFTTEQNQKLNNQIAELEEKMQETCHLGQVENQQLEIPKETALKKQSSQFSQRPSHLQISMNKSYLNKSNLGLNPSTSKEIKKSSEPQSPVLHHRQRSNSGVDSFRQADYISLQQKYQTAELDIQELKGVVSGLKNQIEEANLSNEKLIEQINEYNRLLQQKQDELQQAHFQVDQYKKFQVFEDYYKLQLAKVQELSIKVEELTTETLQKDQKMTELLKESNDIMEQVTLTRKELASRQDDLQSLNNKIKSLNSIISKNKSEYRQYQQSAQLEIMHLKELIDQLKAECQQKDDEKVFLGNQYIDLQHEKDSIKKELELLQRHISKQDTNVQQGESKMNQLELQLEKVETSRQDLLKNVKKIENELMEKSEIIKNMTNDSMLASKKFQIKLQSTQQQRKLLSQKLQQKERVISLLKNEIALYNQQSSQLRKSNDALHYELDKVEKELKDIMQVYSKQIEGMQQNLREKNSTIEDLKNQLLGKRKGEDGIMKQMRNAEKERDASKHELLEVKSLLDKVKTSKMRQLTQANSKYEFKADECEKFKAALEKINTQLALKEKQISSTKNHYQNELQGYKQRYEKYQEVIIELQQQLQKVKDRPTVQTYQQTMFQNELLRNEVEELREQTNKASSSRVKEEQIYVEFKKYKRTREQEIQDLRSEMERYGIKIGEMEECIVDLRKENQLLRENNAILIEQRDQFEAECEDLRESMVDVEKELQFYKKRKMLDMQKLLNQTH